MRPGEPSYFPATRDFLDQALSRAGWQVEQDLANHSLLFVDDVVAESLTSYVAGLQRSLPSNVQFRVVAPFSRAAPWWVAEWLWPRRFTLRSILDRNASPAIVRATEVAIGTIDSSLDIPYSHAQANERSLISIALELDQAAGRLHEKLHNFRRL
jgi:hypothetical protein